MPQSVITGDELFLPPTVRQQRSKDPLHWANPASGWRPIACPPPRVVPASRKASEGCVWVPQQDRDGGEDFVGHFIPLQADSDKTVVVDAAHGEDLSVKSRKNGTDGEALDIDLEKVELHPSELLSPEESQAKSDIWHEVNQDLLEYWALKAQKEKQLMKKREERRLAQEKEQQRSAEEQNREKKKRKLAKTKGDPGVPVNEPAVEQEVDSALIDFWQEHKAATSIFAANPKTGEEARGANHAEEFEELLKKKAQEEAEEARKAVAAALIEDEAAALASRRSREFASELHALFS